MGRPEAPKGGHLVSLLVTSEDPGLHVRTALPLQRELDLEGSGRSGNGLFFQCSIRTRKKGASEHVVVRFLAILGSPREPVELQNGS